MESSNFGKMALIVTEVEMVWQSFNFSWKSGITKMQIVIKYTITGISWISLKLFFLINLSSVRHI